MSKPLTELTNGAKRQKLKWTPEMNQAFESLKLAVQKEVILAYPDYSDDAHPLEIFVDASGFGAGSCLMQQEDGRQRVIAFASTEFSSSETRYSTLETRTSYYSMGY